EQFLAYLYDLLEPTERQALETHLGQCVPCQAALAHSRQQQQLLAAAAKTTFPEVRFQAPAAGEAGHPEPVLRMERRRQPAWGGWAIAASVLLLVGLGVPGTWWTARYV